MMKLCLVCALLMSLLFFLLSPGVLLTLPPNKNCDAWMELKNKEGGCATSYEAVLVHTAVFFLLAFMASYLVCNCMKVKA
jgi:hypothetical protein